MTDLTPLGRAVFVNDEFEIVFERGDDGYLRVLAPGVARALGFRDAARLVDTIPDGDKGYTTASTPGGAQRVWYLTEAGFYRALGQRQAARIPDVSVRAAVERFQAWVYGDVLPSLHKGTPAVASVSRRALAEMVIAEADRADKAEQRAGIAEATVLELHPKAQSWDVLADTGADYSVRDAGYILNRDPAIDTGQKRLFALLREWRLIGRDDRPYANHAAHVTLRPRTRDRFGEDVPAKPQVRITVAGLSYLHKRLGGVEPLRFEGEVAS